MIVVDASAVVEMLLQTPVGRRLEADILAPAVSIHVPELLDLEILQVLRRLVLSRQIGVDRAADAIEDLDGLPFIRHGHALLRSRIWELRTTLTAYDGAYVALAESLDAPCITCDRRMASSTGHGAEMRLER